jgi:uncharacterized protein (DUF849 family)
MTRWITCAVNGSVLSRRDTPHVPITPAEIAADACAAAQAGAAVVHCHVRDPKTGLASNALELYKEVVERIRDQHPDLLIHLTGGGGGTLPISLSAPVIDPGDAASILSAESRLAHLAPAGADLTGLDCGSFSYGCGGDVYLAPTDMLFRAAEILRACGVRPELTVFDLGQMALAVHMLDQGVLPPKTPFCIGFALIWGAPARPSALDAMLDIMPDGALWSAFAKGEHAHHALAPLIVARGGGLRTGIEDHHTHDGAPVTNARLVELAVKTMQEAGTDPIGATALRRHLNMVRR